MARNDEELDHAATAEDVKAAQAALLAGGISGSHGIPAQGREFRGQPLDLGDHPGGRLLV
ncbi:hypothetical protein AB0D94_28395 [Streptomyces sp. NPDC048255]|uniref:hypothetical protein n=1 Tax=Streptomyces sp. NPDC048255 TaxID=3154713 RepID=UPI0033D2C260